MSFLVLLRLSQIEETDSCTRTSDQGFPTGRTLYRCFEACLRSPGSREYQPFAAQLRKVSVKDRTHCFRAAQHILLK